MRHLARLRGLCPLVSFMTLTVMSGVLAPAPTSGITLSPKFQVLTDKSKNLGLADDYSVAIVKQGAFWGSGRIGDQKFEYQLTSVDASGKHKLSGVLLEGIGFKRINEQLKFNLFARFTEHTGEERRICISSGVTAEWTLGCLRGLTALVEHDTLLDPFNLTCSPGNTPGVSLCSVFQYAQAGPLDVDIRENFMFSHAFNKQYHEAKSDKAKLLSLVETTSLGIIRQLGVRQTLPSDLASEEFIEIAPVNDQDAGE